MFLYNNNIVSESNVLVPNLEPHDFFSTSMQCNKKLLSTTIEASRHMLDVLTTYGTSANIVKEAISDYTKAVTSGVHDFNRTTITEAKQWMDSIGSKDEVAGNKYVSESMGTYTVQEKREALKEFYIELPEHEDLGFKTCQEFALPTWFSVAEKAIAKAKSEPDVDINELRTMLTEATTDVTTGLETYQVDVETIGRMNTIKQFGNSRTKDYKDKCIETLATIERAIIGLNDTDPLVHQKKCNNLVAVATCVNEHMCVMLDKYTKIIERFDEIAREFIPQAESYLLNNNKEG